MVHYHISRDKILTTLAALHVMRLADVYDLVDALGDSKLAISHRMRELARRGWAFKLRSGGGQRRPAIWAITDAGAARISEREAV